MLPSRKEPLSLGRQALSVGRGSATLGAGGGVPALYLDQIAPVAPVAVVGGRRLLSSYAGDLFALERFDDLEDLAFANPTAAVSWVGNSLADLVTIREQVTGSAISPSGGNGKWNPYTDAEDIGFDFNTQSLVLPSAVNASFNGSTGLTMLFIGSRFEEVATANETFAYIANGVSSSSARATIQRNSSTGNIEFGARKNDASSLTLVSCGAFQGNPMILACVDYVNDRMRVYRIANGVVTKVVDASYGAGGTAGQPGQATASLGLGVGGRGDAGARNWFRNTMHAAAFWNVAFSNAELLAMAEAVRDAYPAIAGVAGNAKQIVSDGSYSWWISPQAKVIGGSTYFNYVNRRSAAGNTLCDQVVARIDNSTKAVVEKKILYSATLTDDHNAGAIEQTSDGFIMSAYTGHDDDSTIRYRFGTGTTLASLGAEQTLTASGTTTYVQLHINGDDIYLFHRIASTQWALRKGTKAGGFGVERIIVNSASLGGVYLKTVRKSANVIQIFAYLHPMNGGNDLRVAEINLTTGAITSGGVTLGNIDGTDLPTLYADWAAILDVPVDRSIRLSDVYEDGERYLYIKYPDLVTVSGESWLATLTGADPENPAHWTHEFICNTGRAFFEFSSRYTPSCTFSRLDSDTIYVNYNQGAYNYMEEWSRPDPATAWTTTRLDRTASTMMRPISPIGADANLPLLYQRGRYGSGVTATFGVFTTEIVTPN